MKRHVSLFSSLRSMQIKLLFVAAGIVSLETSPAPLLAQQPSVSPSEPFIEEWVYRVRYGHKDEWWQIFRKYQIAILERQRQLGYVKDYTVWAPGLHTD